MNQGAELPSQTVARQVRQIREMRGMDQDELAARLNLLITGRKPESKKQASKKAKKTPEPWTAVTVSRLETGRRKVQLDEIPLLSAALNVAPIHLVHDLSADPRPMRVGHLEIKAWWSRSWWRGWTLPREVEKALELGPGDEQQFQTTIPTAEHALYRDFPQLSKRQTVESALAVVYGAIARSARAKPLIEEDLAHMRALLKESKEDEELLVSTGMIVRLMELVQKGEEV